MAEKTSKIDDVKRPDKVTPSATSRPIVVTNHTSMASDPMMAPSGDKKDEAPAEQPMSHSAKTIKPLDASLSAGPAEPVLEKPGDDGAAEAPKSSPEPAAKGTESAPSKAAAPEPTAEEAATGEASSEVERDGEAAISAEEAAAAEAKAKRDDELEALIASGKYAVPIDAVQRKRSRISALLLCVLAVLLALALLDAAADVGLVKLPAAVPHTHFFSAK